MDKIEKMKIEKTREARCLCIADNSIGNVCDKFKKFHSPPDEKRSNVCDCAPSEVVCILILKCLAAVHKQIILFFKSDAITLDRFPIESVFFVVVVNENENRRQKMSSKLASTVAQT